jgi:hypothetical protein
MGKRRGVYRVLVGKPVEDPGVDGRIILRRIFRKWDVEGGMDWIELAQDRCRWRDLVNAVMILRVA